MIPNVCELEKSEIVDLLLREGYGYLPSAPISVKAELVERDKRFCAGKADLEIYNLVCDCNFGSFSFPIRVVIPKKNVPVPAFVPIVPLVEPLSGIVPVIAPVAPTAATEILPQN